jgi:RHS repeat-associated protein
MTMPIRQTSVKDAAGNVTQYAYDTENNLTGITNANNHTTTFAYDALSRVTQTTFPSSLVETYGYDAVGNLTSKTDRKQQTISYYDANGNTLTDAAGRTYTWDFESRLISVTLPGGGSAVTFKYDPFGRRIYKSSSSGTSIFAYDGDNVVEEADGTEALIARYAQGLGIDEPLAMLAGSTSAYYQADGLGSVTSLSDSAGTVAETYAYDSFGKTTATGSLFNPFQYTGRESDPETGLYYYRARYYEPSAGRFLNEDPIAFRGGINFYSYVADNPVTLVDPGGNDYHVSQQDDTLVVSATVTIYGPNASNGLARSWQNDVNRYWNAGNFRYGKCRVRFDVKFFADPGHNWRWQALPRSDNYVNVIPQKGDERILDETWSSYGRWLSGLTDQDTAHSMGHFFHLGDDYSILFGTKNGHKGHMTSNDLIRNVAQHEVEDIIRAQLPNCPRVATANRGLMAVKSRKYLFLTAACAVTVLCFVIALPIVGSFLMRHRLKRFVKIEATYPGCSGLGDETRRDGCACEFIFEGVFDPSSISFSGSGLTHSYNNDRRAFQVQGTGSISAGHNSIRITADQVIINSTPIPRDRPSAFHVLIKHDGTLLSSRWDLHW